MKSMVISCQAPVDTGKGWSKPTGCVWVFFECWQTEHCWTKLSTSVLSPFQKKIVWHDDRWPELPSDRPRTVVECSALMSLVCHAELWAIQILSWNLMMPSVKEKSCSSGDLMASRDSVLRRSISYITVKNLLQPDRFGHWDCCRGKQMTNSG